MDDITIDNSHLIKQSIVLIQRYNYELKNLQQDKADEEARLRDLLDHTKDGAHAHHFDKYKITITAGYNYTLDTEKYRDYVMLIDPKFDPVRVVTKYELNKKTIKDCELYGGNDNLLVMSKFCTKTPKKLHVKIEVCDEVKNDE